MAHSPVPWDVSKWRDDGSHSESVDGVIGGITDSTGGYVVLGCPECDAVFVSPDDAAFIIRACSAHDDLLAACKLARQDENICRQCFDTLGAAIAKAEETRT